jgi:hypothetical protein
VTAWDFRIDREHVAGQPAAEAAWRAIEGIYDELKTPYEPDSRFDSLTEGQRALYVLHWVQSEVRNGGLEQMYANSAGRFAALAPGAAKLIGAAEYAELFARANALFPTDVPEEQDARQRTLAELVARQGDEIEALEDEFFDLLDHADIYDQMGRFVFERPADFFLT